MDDFKLCECGRKRDAPTKKAALGELIVCSLCDGFIVCDFCKRELKTVGNFPLAMMVMGESFVCGQHAWAGIAIPPPK